MLNNVKKVKFGAPAAERDINQGLKDYFIETGAFNRLKNNDRSIVIGNRGTGKSALIKMLASHFKKEDSIVVEMTPEDYSYDLLKSSMIKESEGSWAKASAFTASWKYLMLVVAMKQYSSNMKTVLKTHAKGIYKYLRDKHKGNSNTNLEIFISYLKRIEGIKIGPYEAGIKTKELQHLFKLEEINSLIPELISLSKRKSIIILVDELDKGWDASEDAKNFVAGLFQAAITMNELSDNIRIIISLRKELHDNIPSLYDDYQKNIDLFESLEWDEESLFELITRRIAYSIKESKILNPTEKWSLIFSKDIFNENTFKYIVSRTLYRPREIIQLCTESQNRAIEKQRDLIDVNSIISAEAKYSENRTKDISAEYKFQYNNLINLFEAFRGCRNIFPRQDLESHCSKIITGEIKTGVPLGWLQGQNEEFIINILWQVGFLSVRTQANYGNEIVEGFWGIHQISITNLGNIQEFSIHPMFRMYLGIKD